MLGVSEVAEVLGAPKTSSHAVSFNVQGSMGVGGELRCYMESTRCIRVISQVSSSNAAEDMEMPVISTQVASALLYRLNLSVGKKGFPFYTEPRLAMR